MDIFVAAMLGKLDTGKPMLAAYPNLVHAKGPHGLTLRFHAQTGGDEAAPMVKYLETLGAIEMRFNSEGQTPAPAK